MMPSPPGPDPVWRFVNVKIYQVILARRDFSREASPLFPILALSGGLDFNFFGLGFFALGQVQRQHPLI